MAWKNTTIGKKIATGFGLTLALLALISGLSYTGISSIVNNAEMVIDGNKLDGIIAQNEVDHLNWVGRVNALLTDSKIHKLDVEKDYHKCNFGKWYYGDGRKSAVDLVPSISGLLRDIEGPHMRLHNSAIEIDKNYSKTHSGLSLELSRYESDHVNWSLEAYKRFSVEIGGIGSYKIRLVNAVDQAYSAIVSSAAVTGMDTSECKIKALKMVRDLRYGPEGKDYFWVNNTDNVMLMQPYKASLIGKDLSGLKDPFGRYLIKEMSEKSLKYGSGFVFYHWPKYGSEKPVPKLSYVRFYKPWNWVVGTGVYLESDNKTVIKRAEEISSGKAFKLGLETDPGNCPYGRWLSSPDTRAILDELPDLKRAVDATVKPHNDLHRSAEHIEQLLNDFEYDQALKLSQVQLNSSLKQFRENLGKAVAIVEKAEEGVDIASDIYANKTVPALFKIQELFKKIRKEVKDKSVTEDILLKGASESKILVTLISLLAIVSGVFLAFIIARGILSVLKRITISMDTGSRQVACAASQVSSASQTLAEGASRQAASLEETASSLEQMAAITKQNAENAGIANDLMSNVKNVVIDANDSMNELTTSMEEMTKASEETSKIIKTIDEIAFQTNLLALNAAVEAARAGEAGAGFAVVADEVRNLAMRAAEAAKNTSELIDGTKQKVFHGSSVVKRTYEAFTKVAESSQKVAQLVSEISSSSEEQAHGIGQVNTAMAEVDKITQQNAASSEESASASEEMSAQAEQMTGVVDDLVRLVGGHGDGKSSGGEIEYVTEDPKLLPKNTEQRSETKKDSMLPYDNETKGDF